MRLAATVMLVQPSNERSIEVFMLRRSSASTFAPDAFVFPGGTVDDSDRSTRARLRTFGADAEWIQGHFRSRDWPSFPSGVADLDPADASALAHTALRELYEEAGVLLVRGREPQIPNTDMPFDELLERYDLQADAGALTLFSQWITPASEPRRYNAFFFLARAKPEHAPRADAYETHDGIWITPSEALERFRAGTFHLVYPTIKHLERLAKFDDVDALFEFAARKPIYRIMPRERDVRWEFEIPQELEHAW